MNYSEMTDFEINKAVASHHLEEWYANGICVIKCDDDDRSIFNPCSSWADAGTIIEKSRMSLTPYAGGWHAFNDDAEKIYTDENPLRAAMIVFLMMQDSK